MTHIMVQGSCHLSGLESVWLSDRQEIVEETAPRSYNVQTEDGTYRQNRRHIVPAPSHEFEDTGETSPPAPSVDEPSPAALSMPSIDEPCSTSSVHSQKKIVTCSLSGKLPKPRDMLDPSWTKS